MLDCCCAAASSDHCCQSLTCHTCGCVVADVSGALTGSPALNAAPVFCKLRPALKAESPQLHFDKNWAAMLVRTSSGNTSVGHLSHSPHGFSSLHRSDYAFQCGGLLFPVHSLLLSASSKFFTEFFQYIKGQKAPAAISLDAVKCKALNAISLGYYLEFVYSCGCLPSFDTVPEMVEVLHLADFFGNTALVSQLGTVAVTQLPSLGEKELLEVFRAAADLKLRHLVTECLVLLLPQFGRCTAEGTVAAVIDHMDGALSKAVLAQLAIHGMATAASSSVLAVPAPVPGLSSAATEEGVRTPGRQDSGEFGAAAGAAGRLAGLPSAPAPALDLELVKLQFMRVLEAKGWGQ